MAGRTSPARKPTATSHFGVGRRENHDASAFYARFAPPRLSDDDQLGRTAALDVIHCADARQMTHVADASVALVVTSPPYFAGKEYEAALGADGIPASYREYLELLHAVFAECVRVLEPGGRIAVNVANLGRKPYRSLAADVIGILQDRLGLLLRGEIIWQKARGAGGNCAWGSFQSATNPVLRDLTERVVVASKGRFDRARPRAERQARGLPHLDTIGADEFMASTVDVWEIAPESATRVGHPAPFPVALPARLIELYTFANDVVLDPFIGSGTAAVAALRAGRHFIGYDTDPDYVDRARQRVDDERLRLSTSSSPDPALPVASLASGRKAKEVAEEILTGAGFEITARDRKVAPGITVAFECRDASDHPWLVDLVGAFGPTAAGLRRTDMLQAALGRAAIVAADPRVDARLLLITTDLPVDGTPGDAAIRAVRGGILFDTIELLSGDGIERLAVYARGTDTPADPYLPGIEHDPDPVTTLRRLASIQHRAPS